MVPLLGNLSASLRGPLELILYIGAGSGVDLSDYAALNARQFLFVEGDPDAAELLAQSLAGKSSCQVLSALVTPNGARTRFYRYNLPVLNGTLPLGGLRALYPRLKVMEELELSSKSLSTVLETIPLSGAGKRLLILDIPGQETAILESVSPEQLHAFDWILVRGCKTALQEAAQPLEATIARLGERGSESIATDEESDPQWPFVLLHFDRRLADLYQECETRTQLLVAQATENRRQAERIVALEAQLKAGQEELDLARQQNEQPAGRVAELEAQLNSSQAELESARKQLGESADRESAANAELEYRARLLAEGATENDHQARRIAELGSRLKLNQDELESARRQLREANQRIQDIEAAKTEAAKTLPLPEVSDPNAAAMADPDNRWTQLGSASERASSLEAELASQKMLVEVLGKGRSQQDKLYQQLAQERDGLRRDVETLNRRILEMEELLSSKENRGRLIDAEFQKVEGQIDLIKEIFLRENT